MNKNSSDENKINYTYKKIVYVINIVGGVVVFIYAYLYLLGYFYLSSYFGEFGIKIIEMKFSITDFATTTIYPVFNIIVTSIAFLIVYMFLGIIFKKKPWLQYSIILILFFLQEIYIFINFKKNYSFNHIEYYIINTIILLCSIVLIVIYYESKRKNGKYGRGKLLLILLILLLLPMSSIYAGKFLAYFNGEYAFNIFRGSRINPLINLSTTESIKNLEYLETEKYIYPSLSLIIFKDDFYYFYVTENSIKFAMGWNFNKAGFWGNQISNILIEMLNEGSIQKQEIDEIRKLMKKFSYYNLNQVSEVRKNHFDLFEDTEKEVWKMYQYSDNVIRLLNKEPYLGEKHVKSQIVKLDDLNKLLRASLDNCYELDAQKDNLPLNKTVFAVNKNNIKSLTYIYFR